MANRWCHWCLNGCGKKVTTTISIADVEAKYLPSHYCGVGVYICQVCKQLYVKTEGGSKLHPALQRVGTRRLRPQIIIP